MKEEKVKLRNFVKEKIKGYVRYQFTNLQGVVPGHHWCNRTNTFFLNSSAGLIRYKPKDVKAATEFRNLWINEFDFLVKKHNRGEDVRRQMFWFYRRIKKVKRVRYRANINTRTRARLCSLGLLF